MRRSEEQDADSSQLKPPIPIELLPNILEHLAYRTGDLAACARVNSLWREYAQPLLYERIFLRNALLLTKVFDSLARHLYNAKHIKIVEIRAFPLALTAEEQEHVEVNIVTVLKHATSLRELVWTRTGSLNDRVIVELFPHLRQLRRLEITGDTRTFDPALLIKSLRRPTRRFKAEQDPLAPTGFRLAEIEDAQEPGSDDDADSHCVQSLSLILPDRRMAAKLTDFAEHLGGQLRGLNVLCYHTSHVTDACLQAAAPHLPLLTRLSVAGSKAVSVKGVLPILQAARGQLQELALESLSLQPSDFAQMAPSLQNLRLLSLTYPKAAVPAADFLRELGNLFERLEHLDSFTFYAPGGTRGVTGGEGGADSDDEDGAADGARPPGGGIPMSGPALSTAFLQRLLRARGPQLRQLRLHGIGMSLEQLGMLCEACGAAAGGRLADLVVHLYEADPGARRICAALGKLDRLKDLHILSSADADLVLTEDDLRTIADAAPVTLRQVGFRHRVWLVDRSAYDRVSKSGSQLRRWDLGAGAFFWPEAILVVRT